jgi:phosphonate transport system permease protein
MTVQAYKKSKRQLTIFFVILISITLLSAKLTDFNFLHGIQTLPKAIGWMFSNLYITAQSLEKFPSVMDKLLKRFFSRLLPLQQPLL